MRWIQFAICCNCMFTALACPFSHYSVRLLSTLITSLSRWTGLIWTVLLRTVANTWGTASTYHILKRVHFYLIYGPLTLWWHKDILTMLNMIQSGYLEITNPNSVRWRLQWIRLMVMLSLCSIRQLSSSLPGWVLLVFNPITDELYGPKSSNLLVTLVFDLTLFFFVPVYVCLWTRVCVCVCGWVHLSP